MIFDRQLNISLKKLKEVILAYKPDVIGISAVTSQSYDAELIIKKVREWMPNIIIIVGGVHFTAEPQDGLDYGADYVFRGEGEKSLLDFMNNGPPKDNKIIWGEPLENLDDIPNLTMDDIEPYIEINRWGPRHFFYLIGSRGCPYNCNFCLGKDQRPKGIRYHSIERIIDFISQIVEKFEVYRFLFVDDIFVMKNSRVREFCERIKKEISVPLYLNCLTHAGHGNSELYHTMRKSGFTGIGLGVEHGNDRILSIIGKNATKAKIEETCIQIYKAGIKLHLLYILGNITETNETITETVDFAIYLHNKYKAKSWFSFMQPLPGAPIYKVAEKYGYYLPKKRIFQYHEISYVPFNATVKHMIKERKRGMIMGNYFGLLRSYKMIKLIHFLRDRTKNIWGKKMLIKRINKIALILEALRSYTSK
ncbi:MAG: B12-binding domain-containing radical SAM protein [Promethearchaeota archaeon]|nr:MAG: B12-binding domain-containing radical SAM protein [Candidatus Lokiarchaeota archaeon]